jgi:hypothetical protein
MSVELAGTARVGEDEGVTKTAQGSAISFGETVPPKPSQAHDTVVLSLRFALIGST